MLVDLTVDEKVVAVIKKNCVELGLPETILSSHQRNHIETGVYRCGMDHNFGCDEFNELKNLSYEEQYQAMVRKWSDSV